MRRGFEVADESPTDSPNRIHAQSLADRLASGRAGAGVEAAVVLRALDLAVDQGAVGKVDLGVRAEAVAERELVVVEPAQHERALADVDAAQLADVERSRRRRGRTCRRRRAPSRSRRRRCVARRARHVGHLERDLVRRVVVLHATRRGTPGGTWRARSGAGCQLRLDLVVQLGSAGYGTLGKM